MGSKKVCRWSLLFSLCLHFTTKSWYLQKKYMEYYCCYDMHVNFMSIKFWRHCGWVVRALDLSLVVSGSALHPNTHCFVLGCPKFNSQAVLVKSLLVCPLASWDLCFCNVIYNLCELALRSPTGEVVSDYYHHYYCYYFNNSLNLLITEMREARIWRGSQTSEREKGYY